VLVAALCVAAPVANFAQSLPPEGWKPVLVDGARLPCLRGRREEALVVLGCGARCVPIPFQVDERDAAGRLVLNAGPFPDGPDESPGLDDNDELVVMAADLGRPARPGELPEAVPCTHAVHIRGESVDGWFYVAGATAPAPRSPRRYVSYDPESDVFWGRRVAIRFGAATPRALWLREPDGKLGGNLLDRLKIRASARFFGFIPLGRDEDDIESRYVAWKIGTVRVLRREEKWVRLGFGLRTPIFRSETTFYPDYVELPVRLRLNFPPAHFFSAIEVRALLDFADLRGWRLRVPSTRVDLQVGADTEEEGRGLDDLEVGVAALAGPEATLVLALDLGPSLSSLRRTLLYREDRRRHNPEEVRGELPGVGFRLTEWEHVDRGHHAFTATSYALPAGYDLEAFARERRRGWSIETTGPLAPGAPTPVDPGGANE